MRNISAFECRVQRRSIRLARDWCGDTIIKTVINIAARVKGKLSRRFQELAKSAASGNYYNFNFYFFSFLFLSSRSLLFQMINGMSLYFHNSFLNSFSVKLIF